MAARKLAQKPVADNPPVAAVRVNMVEHAAAAWAAVEYLTKKNVNRDELTAGAAYDVKLQIVAQVDSGPIYRAGFAGLLTVGHDAEVASSHVPGGDKLLLAVAFSKMNAATREATIRDILADYAGGKLPEVDAGLLAAVENLQSQLRAGAKCKRRGAVKYDGKPAQPALSLVMD